MQTVKIGEMKLKSCKSSDLSKSQSDGRREREGESERAMHYINYAHCMCDLNLYMKVRSSKPK